MSETVVLPTHPLRPRGNSFIVPLLVVPFLLYNLVVFLFFGGNPVNWGAGLFAIPMPSGMPWAVTAGDLLLVVGIIMLFVEVLKSTGTSRNSIIEHMLSMVLFVVFLIEFLLVGAASSSVFFLLMVMSLIDVVAGFTVSITSASRDVSMS
ncbi:MULTISPECIES: hypothetical protein [Devosia]|uniref:Uncharacterized protein n=2 Tax=Devosia TaxID=46913 RepID=A0A6M1STV3_9HYPH|nr:MULTISPECIES: hypothetical protein [Devosia]NGP16371.1 hypothetical protein [Devosia aurantiaca]QQR39363.1 hypothetical protein JI748_16855 [Devosia rhizoryzae]